MKKFLKAVAAILLGVLAVLAFPRLMPLMLVILRVGVIIAPVAWVCIKLPEYIEKSAERKEQLEMHGNIAELPEAITCSALDISEFLNVGGFRETTAIAARQLIISIMQKQSRLASLKVPKRQKNLVEETLNMMDRVKAEVSTFLDLGILNRLRFWNDEDSTKEEYREFYENRLQAINRDFERVKEILVSCDLLIGDIINRITSDAELTVTDELDITSQIVNTYNFCNDQLTAGAVK